MRALKQHGYLLALLAISVCLRFIPLFNYQFTFDELSGLDRTQFNDYGTLLEKGVKIDAHPALIQTLLFVLVKLFGFSSSIIKLPFLLFGHAAIIYGYLIGVKFFNRQTAAINATFLALSLIFVFYAPIARMYIAGVFFSLAALYYAFNILYANKVSAKSYVLFAVFILLGALNHHMNALFGFTLAAFSLFQLPNDRKRKFIIACSVAVLLYLPHLPITLYQLSIPGIGADAGGWLTPPAWHAGLDFVRVVLGTGYSYAAVAFFCGFAFFLNKKKENKKVLFLLLLFSVNYGIIHLYSIFRSPIFQYSVMLFAATALLLAVSALMASEHKIFNNVVLAVLACMLFYQTYLRKDYLSQAVETVYDYQFAQTIKYKNKLGNDNVCPLFFDCDTLMRAIYFKKYNTAFDFKMSNDTIINSGIRSYIPNNFQYPLNDTVISTLRLFSEFVYNCKADYMVLSSAPPLYQAIVQEVYPYLLENTQTQAINYKVFARFPQKYLQNDAIVYESSIDKPAATNFQYKSLPQKCDSTVEFPFKWTTKYNVAATKEGQYIMTAVEITCKKPFANNLELVMSVNDTSSAQTVAYSAKSAGDFHLKNDSTVVMYADQYVGVDYEKNCQNSVLTTYLWNRGKQQFHIHKIRNFTVDYWPLKWQWWQ